MFASSTLVALALAAQAIATVRITAPFATTTCTGGQPCSVTWDDDGAAPPLAQFGAAHVGLFVGGTVQQIELQPITDAVNVATTAQIQFTVDPNIGPNGNFYFVRFISAQARDPNFPTQPLSSFSAKFTLAGMRGQFNATVQGVVDNANNSAAPPAGSTPATPAASTPAASTPAATSRPATTAASSAATSRPASSGSATGTAGAQQTGAATRSAVAGVSILSGIGAVLAFVL